MSQVIKLKKGLDILLEGEAKRELTRLPLVHAYALKPEDFPGVTPKLLVRVDDEVKVGTPLFFDKYRPQILFTSPVSGKVSAIVRGEKRKILEVVIDVAKRLHISTVAEGIETAEHVQLMQEMHCDYGQGYYYSKPIPAERFTKTFLIPNAQSAEL